VLMAAAVVLVVVAEIADEPDQLIDAGLIGLIVLLNASLGFTQNYRGIESLTRLSAPAATALRDGVPEQINSNMLVPGGRPRALRGGRSRPSRWEAHHQH
jgi:Ca2+-transporting ATPase